MPEAFLTTFPRSHQQPQRQKFVTSFSPNKPVRRNPEDFRGKTDWWGSAQELPGALRWLGPMVGLPRDWADGLGPVGWVELLLLGLGIRIWRPALVEKPDRRKTP